jgi:hypothetical protein
VTRFHDKILFNKKKIGKLSDPDFNFGPMVGQTVFIDASKSSDVETVVVPNIREAIK